MKITLSWLKTCIETNASASEITNALVSLGHEVEEVINRADSLKGFKIAYIKDAKKHPNADSLKICEVDSGSEILKIVCGAPNARSGIKVVLAPIGTEIHSAGFTIKKTKIRGEESNGMLCSASELNIGKDSDGIIELDSNAEIGASFAEYCGYDDVIIDIDITPNRGDCVSVWGIARELAAKGLGELKNTNFAKPENAFDFPIEIDTKASDIFGLCYGKNIDNSIPTPEYIKQRIEAVGIKSINIAVDICNYVSHMFGQPLHIYDASKIEGPLTVKILDEEVKFSALDEIDYDLKPGDLVVSDKNRVQCLAGIMGASYSACSISTKDVLIEAAHFSDSYIRKTSKRLKINSDSKYRFERIVTGCDAKFAANYAAYLINKYCYGEIYEFSYKGAVKKPIEIEFEHSLIKKKLGIEISPSEATAILDGLGFTGTTPPVFRTDIAIAEDIIEEIARVYGYNNIPAVPIECKISKSTFSTKANIDFLSRRILSSYGYYEVYTWSFMNSVDAEKFFPLHNKLYIENPISSELNYMRQTIAGNILQAIAKNEAYGIKNCNFFELGPIFFEDYSQTDMLVFAKSMKKNENNFYEIKKDFSSLCNNIGVNPDIFSFNIGQAPSYYHPTRSASVSLGKMQIASIGALHPNILKYYDISNEVILCEIILKNLPKPKYKNGFKGSFKSPQYQLIEKDFSFIFDKDQEIGPVIGHINKLYPDIITSTKVFDIYTKDLNGKKSVAIRCCIQPHKCTLIAAEIEEVMNNIINSVQNKFSAKLRLYDNNIT